MEDIVIVGASSAGLALGGSLKKRGLTPLLVDQEPTLGGRWASRYDRLTLNTARFLSSLPHYPIPRTYPLFLHRDHYVEYLQKYRQHFELDVQMECRVDSISPHHDHWSIQGSKGKIKAKVLVMCTGHQNLPNRPKWPGQDLFSGSILHSSEYRNGQGYKDKRVLVIGGGTSGAEISTDLTKSGSSRLCLSVRTPPFVAPKQLWGIPIQLLALLLAPLPENWGEKIAMAATRWAYGDLEKLGLALPEVSPITDGKFPILENGFADALRQGLMTILPTPVEFDQQGVRFSDGHREDFDTIILATGFQSGLQNLLDAPKLFEATGDPVENDKIQLTHPGLFFLGFSDSLAGLLFDYRWQAPRLAKRIQRYLGLLPRRV